MSLSVLVRSFLFRLFQNQPLVLKRFTPVHRGISEKGGRMPMCDERETNVKQKKE